MRYVASPIVKDKLTDSPVLVMDEDGCFLIPLLSGHLGGGMELGGRIAKCSGARLVVDDGDRPERKVCGRSLCQGKQDQAYRQSTCKRDFRPDLTGRDCRLFIRIFR